jgi:hypothetical protein
MLKYLPIRDIYRNYAPKLSNQEHLNSFKEMNRQRALSEF